MTSAPALREAAIRLLGPCEITADLGTAVAQVTTTSGSSFVIKHHGSRAKHDREVHAYRHWTRALGPAVPELVAADHSARIIITTAIPGQPCPAGATPAVFGQAGALLRRFHDAEPPGDLPWYRSWLQERGRYWSGQARTLLSDSDADLLTSHLAALRSGPAPRGGPCHLDFQPRNWIVGPSGGVWIIDFEHSRIDVSTRDFVRLHFHVWPTRPDLHDAFLDGYGRRLTTAEDELIWHLGALDALTSLARGRQTANEKLTAAGLTTLRQISR